MLERQREGIAKARAEGRYKGRAPTARRQAATIRALRTEGVRPSEIARRLLISRSSVYAALRAVEQPADAGDGAHLVAAGGAATDT